MKLSICIPTFNEDITTLVSALQTQILKERAEIEIIVIDDASEQAFRRKNSAIANIRYIQLEQNVGRGAIHNLFLEYSNAEYLLFMDCDVEIPQDFIEKYLSEFQDNTEVIYGGFLAKGGDPNSLRNRYSVGREIQNAEIRKRIPYRTFKTVNFVLRRKVLQNYPFNPELSQYGYVDFIFAQQLREHNIQIVHIDNPVSHVDRSSNAAYLRKTEKAIEKLQGLYESQAYRKYANEVKLIHYVEKLHRMRLSEPYYFLFRRYKERLRKNLVSKETSLHWLDIYKLGLFLELEKTRPISSGKGKRS